VRDNAEVLIYKLLGVREWRDAKAQGAFQGSAADLADGFIHFSTADQVVHTAARHFADRSELALLAIDTDLLGDELRWEPARGGALFPHLYAPLPVLAVVEETELPDGVATDVAVARILAE
jgi:uncharacterized protein (DUF952 family)